MCAPLSLACATAYGKSRSISPRSVAMRIEAGLLQRWLPGSNIVDLLSQAACHFGNPEDVFCDTGRCDNYSVECFTRRSSYLALARACGRRGKRLRVRRVQRERQQRIVRQAPGGAAHQQTRRDPGVRGPGQANGASNRQEPAAGSNALATSKDSLRVIL